MPDSRRTWLRRWGPRLLIGTLYGGLAVMLVMLGRKLEWNEVGEALDAMPAHNLFIAGLCSAACYACYAGYEILAARLGRVALGKPTVATIGFASYALNMTLGATLGAVGLRLRAYSARGIGAGKVMSLVAFNLLTNWSGYLLVMGLVLILQQSPAPATWPVSGIPLRMVGTALLALLVVYLVLCARHSDRTWTWRKLRFRLPALKMAGVQLALSAPVWLLGAASLDMLLPEVPFDLLLVSLLASAMAGLVIRIPAGLGVMEATLIASLGPNVGHGPMLAALLAYRCIHYLAPLVAGLLVVLGLELQQRTQRSTKAKARPERPAPAQPCRA
ncbi:MAG TPA: YbhN family protein [Dokdonella sp.]|nr:YbhN family protein [Dokdonella sp.]